MNIDHATNSKYIPFLPSGTNPLYSESKKIEQKKEETEIEPVKEVSGTDYSRNATIRTRERGTSIDIIV